ncbi:MAG: hypothetical protein IPJ19_18795 [Planctomycetes bacterium]|nr:hypothetical protein [Planctomycetota bacterium]
MSTIARSAHVAISPRNDAVMLFKPTNAAATNAIAAADTAMRAGLARMLAAA